MTFIRHLAPETPLLPRDLCNYNASFRRDLRQGHSSTEALIQHLEIKGIKHNILRERKSGWLKGLFIACPESIQYLQQHHDVILINNTYSTNRFKIPLMDIIGVDHNKRSFFVAFAFLPDQSEATYNRALTELKSLFDLISPVIGLTPPAISTHCDQALRNAIATIFPDPPTLLCPWHANKNIQQHCKDKFTSVEAYNDFFKAWLGIVQPSDIPEYQSRLLQFLTTYSDTPEYEECARHVQTTWLRPDRAEALIQAYTNKYPHFGITVTSRYINTLKY